VLGHELGQTRDFFLGLFSSDQIQVALHLFNYNCINYKILHHMPSLKNSMQIPLLEISHDNFLGASMCFNAPNQSLILMATSLKTKLRRCNLTSLFLIKGLEQELFFNTYIGLPPICCKWQSVDKDFSLAPYVFLKLKMATRFV
jgi:hypothetical protein